MRVVAGKYRGRVLASFQGEDVRPTADRVKESLFQILSKKIVGARVLDLFCGSGSLGIECLSRGANEVIFNDCSKESLSITKKNLQKIGENMPTLNCDFRACLERVNGKFDLILCDPPYKMELVADILQIVRRRALLNEGGLVVYESEREELPAQGFVRVDLRSYGRTKVSFFIFYNRGG